MYTRGSEWGIWDLHVHTPASSLNNEFGDNWDEYVKILFRKAVAHEIKAIGITDYFSIKGYHKIKSEYLGDNHKLNTIFQEDIEKDPSFLQKVRSILVLPNIEFRANDFILYYKGTENHANSKLQFHVIFDNNVSVEDITENFLHKLDLTGEFSHDSGTDKYSLTDNNLIRLGKAAKELGHYTEHSDIKVGLNCASVSFPDAQKLLITNMFKNKHMIIIAEDDMSAINWNDSCGYIRKSYYSLSNGIFSANPKTIQWCKSDAGIEKCGSIKPCLWGSDAHNSSKLFIPEQARYCWIKSNPTFEGLMQVFYSPTERVFIGAKPPKLQAFDSNKMYYIDSISINKVHDFKHSETWFDCNIPLNIGLTAIIGNKGSGKSALSDIIGLACHSENIKDHGSFLHKDRFCDSTKSYSDDYQVSVKWADSHEDALQVLTPSKVSVDVSKAQYLPQKFIETVCNNLGKEFQNEIDSLIFSYLGKGEKTGYTSLKGLIDSRTESMAKDINSIAGTLLSVNKDIIELESKTTKEYQDQIDLKLRTLQQELERVNKDIPQAIPKPSEDGDSEKVSAINAVNNFIADYEKDILKFHGDIRDINDQLRELKELLRSIEQFSDSFNNINATIDAIQKKYAIDTDGLSIKLEVKNDSLMARINKLESDLKTINRCIGVSDKDARNDTADSTDSKSVASKEVASFTVEEIATHVASITSYIERVEILKFIKDEISTQTTTEQQKYQQYLKDVDTWKKKIDAIQHGDDENEGIDYYQAEQSYISEKLGIDLQSLYDTRFAHIQKVYSLNQSIVKVYEAIYFPVQEKLKSILKSIDDEITFTADIKLAPSFINTFLSKINQTFEGPFRGKAEGYSKIEERVRATKFNEIDSFLSFVTTLFSDLNQDCNKTNKMLKSNPADMYNFIAAGSYLEVDYTLKVGNKTLDKLSAGEKGAVLLIFYLALDKGNSPLIIDQPEDNLDNQSVFGKLVPCICQAKQNRQVIIVTHNPNIAIACDAEEIVFCNMDKMKYSITYKSGAIENSIIRNKVIDVLEGTQPAFDLRKLKYTLSRSDSN